MPDSDKRPQSPDAIDTLPLISVGVPVFNEGRFLEKTLESLLQQTYTNLELIISDNGSTDDTARICEKFTAHDSRIQFHRFEQNQGAVPNFSYVLEKASGDYFMWASGHDLWAPNYLQACCEALVAKPNAVLAFGSTRWIDADDQNFAKETGWTDTRGMSPIPRYMTVYWGSMNPILGLIRTSALRRCRLVATTGMDLIVLTELSLLGDFIHADSTDWCRREFRNEKNFSDKLKRYRDSDYALDRSLVGRWLPLLRLPVELLRVVTRSQLSSKLKIALFFFVLVNLPVKYLSDRLLR